MPHDSITRTTFFELKDVHSAVLLRAETMNRSILVYGPQGCGKSANADLLANYFGLNIIIEEAPNERECVPRHGVLVLTNARRLRGVSIGVQHALRYTDAMHLVKTHGRIQS